VASFSQALRRRNLHFFMPLAVAMDADTSIWHESRKSLQRKLDKDSYTRFIHGISLVDIDHESDVVTLAAPGDLLRLWLDANYKGVVSEVVAETLGKPVAIEFVVATDTAAPAPEPLAPKRGRKARDSESPSPYRPDFTFETFVVGNNNRIVHAAASAVAESPGKAYNPLFIYGGVGLGKTHLLQAIASEVHRRRKRAKTLFLTSEEFVNMYVEALQSKKLPQFRKQMRSLDLLAIDDVQFFEGKVSTSEEFFHTFNALHNAHRQIVLASDRTPQELSGLEQRLVSRFEWGIAEEILPPDFETRVAILKQKQTQHKIKLDDDVLYLIAKNIPSNIRNLEGALTKLIMHMSAFGNGMTAERAEDILRDRFDSEASQALTIEAIQRRVAEHFDIRFADMTSSRRPKNIAEPRMVAMYLSRTLTNQSLPVIGEAFRRNHATIHHAVDAIEKRMVADESLRMHVGVLQRQLRP
jgi:chromosomal replication initiator protein